MLIRFCYIVYNKTIWKISIFRSNVLYAILYLICIMVQNNDGNSNGDNRGQASADEETRERVAKKGGEAPYEERGLQAADEETRESCQ